MRQRKKYTFLSTSKYCFLKILLPQVSYSVCNAIQAFVNEVVDCGNVSIFMVSVVFYMRTVFKTDSCYVNSKVFPIVGKVVYVLQYKSFILYSLEF